MEKLGDSKVLALLLLNAGGMRPLHGDLHHIFVVKITESFIICTSVDVKQTFFVNSMTNI